MSTRRSKTGSRCKRSSSDTQARRPTRSSSSTSSSEPSTTERRDEPYTVRLTPDAGEDLRRLDPATRERVHTKLKLLRVSPRTAAGVTALVGLRGHRMKIGRLRARFDVRDDDRT